MTVLDTDFLVSLLRGRSEAADLARGISSPRTTTVNAFELYYGAKRSKKPEVSLREVRSLLGSVEILALDLGAALRAAEAQAALEKEGKPVNLLDVLIAGIAMAHGEELWSRNEDHFRRIPGLKWRRW